MPNHLHGNFQCILANYHPQSLQLCVRALVPELPTLGSLEVPRNLHTPEIALKKRVSWKLVYSCHSSLTSLGGVILSCVVCTISHSFLKGLQMPPEAAGLITHTHFCTSSLMFVHVFPSVIFAWVFLLWEIRTLNI